MINKSYKYYILIISIALTGLIVVQYEWINSSLASSEDKFTKDMRNISEELAQEIEEDQLCFELLAERKINPGEDFYMMIPDSLGRIDTMEAHYWNAYGEDTLFTKKKMSFSVPALVRIDMKFEYLLDTSWREMEKLSELERRILYYNGKSISVRENNIEQKLIDTVLLEELLRAKIEKYGVSSQYEYAIYNEVKEEFIYSTSKADNNDIMNSSIGAILFEETKFLQPLKFFLYFPDKQQIFIKNEALMVISSFSLILLLILLIMAFLKSILNQRKLTQMKVDFINNMTHEFSTPVANINLALDTLQKKDKYTDELDQEKVMEIIREENYRLKRNVDTLLNTSKLGAKRFEINKSKVDLHQLIKRVAEVFELTHNEKRLKLKCDLKAEYYLVNIDEVHLTNVLHNLLDNAYKYSKDPVEIQIMTKNEKQSIVLSIKDNGKGIKKSEMNLIYEKFYRIKNNNQHDIKGFGLGLYYVKTIIEAHHGRLAVESELECGTSFNIYLPEKHE